MMKTDDEKFADLSMILAVDERHLRAVPYPVVYWLLSATTLECASGCEESQAAWFERAWVRARNGKPTELPPSTHGVSRFEFESGSGNLVVGTPEGSHEVPTCPLVSVRGQDGMGDGCIVTRLSDGRFVITDLDYELAWCVDRVALLYLAGDLEDHADIHTRECVAFADESSLAFVGYDGDETWDVGEKARVLWDSAWVSG